VTVQIQKFLLFGKFVTRDGGGGSKRRFLRDVIYECPLKYVFSKKNSTKFIKMIFLIERIQNKMINGLKLFFTFRSHTMSKLSRVVKFIFIIWVLAFGLALPQALQFGTISFRNEEFVSCTVNTFIFFY